MKHSCRFCSYLLYGAVLYCGYFENSISNEAAVKDNSCPRYGYSGVDMIGTDFNVKKPKKKDDGQMSFFE